MNPNEFKSRIKALSSEQQRELLALLKHKLAENTERKQITLDKRVSIR